MKKTAIECDRCKRDISPDSGMGGLWGLRVLCAGAHWANADIYDLCGDCRYQLEKFIKGVPIS